MTDRLNILYLSNDQLCTDRQSGALNKAISLTKIKAHSLGAPSGRDTHEYTAQSEVVRAAFDFRQTWFGPRMTFAGGRFGHTMIIAQCAKNAPQQQDMSVHTMGAGQGFVTDPDVMTRLQNPGRTQKRLVNSGQCCLREAENDRPHLDSLAHQARTYDPFGPVPTRGA